MSGSYKDYSSFPGWNDFENQKKKSKEEAAQKAETLQKAEEIGAGNKKSPSRKSNSDKSAGRKKGTSARDKLKPKKGASKKPTAEKGKSKKASLKRPSETIHADRSKHRVPPKRAVRRRRKKGAKLAKAVIARSIFFILIAAIISAALISVANDAFALTKTDTTEVMVTIPEGASTRDIAKILKDNDLIKYKWAYVFYAKMTKEDGNQKYGDFLFSYDMTYDNIMTTLKKGSFSETNPNDVRLMIPEGYEGNQIIDLLVENGLGTKEAFEEVVNSRSFGYSFIEDIPEDRSYFRMEGYLFPDTYIFSKTEGEASIIKRMIKNFDSKITIEMYDRMKELGLTLDQTITLASMIEREAGNIDDMPLISSVFHNRLNSDYKYLESDATIQYVFDERKDVISYEDTDLDDPYNTYKYAGLPPGPIASPGLAAIKAALYPADTNYYYFVARGDGTSIFSETYAQHQKNVAVASRTWNR